MKETFLRYYQQFSWLPPLVFFKEMLYARSKLELAALINRQKDYLLLKNNADLLALHLRLNEQLLKSQQLWKSYDYGVGYFYQSLADISIRGFRNTAWRLQQMGLASLLKHKKVLEIGCNTGFLSMEIAKHAGHVTGFDINPYLIEIGKLVQRYLKRGNVELQVSTFEDFLPTLQFDAVLSFANHATYDKNIRFTLQQYFDKCLQLIKPGGWFLFESHPPQHEGKAWTTVIALIEERFSIEQHRFLQGGSLLDNNRTYLVARKK